MARSATYLTWNSLSGVVTVGATNPLGARLLAVPVAAPAMNFPDGGVSVKLHENALFAVLHAMAVRLVEA